MPSLCSHRSGPQNSGRFFQMQFPVSDTAQAFPEWPAAPDCCLLPFLLLFQEKAGGEVANATASPGAFSGEGGFT